MAIKLKYKPTSITVYDNDIYKHATKDEIVSLCNTNNTINKKELLFNIIADSLYLTNSEKEVYEYITKSFSAIKIYHPNDDILDYDFLIRDCAIHYNKSETTTRRSIDTLVTKGIITYNRNQRYIMLVLDYDITTINNNIKYIVIDI